MTNINTYKSSASGQEWTIYRGVYYDCHVVSIPQVLGQKLFHEWMTIVAAPTVCQGWQAMYCRQKLDSEIERDKILLDLFGVTKTLVNIDGDPCATIEEQILKNGYLICRVDSYYHPHFHHDYHKNHSPGHKVTVIDFDDDSFTLIDNNGMHSSILTLGRDEMIDSVLSNLYYSYDKEDTFYYLCAPTKDKALQLRSGINTAIEKTMQQFISSRIDVVNAVHTLAEQFPDALQLTPEIRAYSWLRHVYKTALTLEFCYNALLETRLEVSHLWEKNLRCSSDCMFEALGNASTAWKHLKMQCKTAEAAGEIKSFSPRVEKALDIILEREATLHTLLDTPKV